MSVIYKGRLGLTWTGDTAPTLQTIAEPWMDNRQMINSWQTSKRGSCVRKAWKPPSSRPILISIFEFRSKASFDHYCHLHKPLLAPQINRDKILFSHTRRWYQFRFLNFFLLFYIIINFYKNYFNFNFSFPWKLFLFFHVPGCSGMFHVPCFIDAWHILHLVLHLACT